MFSESTFGHYIVSGGRDQEHNSGDDSNNTSVSCSCCRHSWSRPPGMILTAENGPGKNVLGQDESSCSPAHDSGGLKAVAEDREIVSKKIVLFLRN